MAQAKNKTVETKASVKNFVASIPDPAKREGTRKLIELFGEQTGLEPRLWGTGGIIGFGSYHYKYDSGHEGDAPLVGFAPRKQNFTLYIVYEGIETLLDKFGKHKLSKACIYINKLEDIDTNVLKKMITNSVKQAKAKYK